MVETNDGAQGSSRHNSLPKWPLTFQNKTQPQTCKQTKSGDRLLLCVCACACVCVCFTEATTQEAARVRCHPSSGYRLCLFDAHKSLSQTKANTLGSLNTHTDTKTPSRHNTIQHNTTQQNLGPSTPVKRAVFHHQHQPSLLLYLLLFHLMLLLLLFHIPPAGPHRFLTFYH